MSDSTIPENGVFSKVFDRDATENCPIDGFLTPHENCFCYGLEGIEGDEDFDKKKNKAIGENWRSDTAIGTERTQEIQSFIDGVSPQGQLDALNKLEYRASNSEKNQEPFYRADKNRGNLIFQNARERKKIYYKLGSNGIKFKTKLFRILPLHESAVPLIKNEFARAVNQTNFNWMNPIEDMHGLFQAILDSNQQQRIQIANWILGSYSDDQRRQFDPWWATLRSDINEQDLRSSNWRNINDQLGLGFSDPAKPLLGIEYPVSCIEALYRPSTFEAGSYSFFHTAEPKVNHGRTLPLSARAHSAPEFIHEVLKKLTYDECKVYVGWSDHNQDDYANEILEHRDRHQQETLKNESPECADWANRYW